MFKIISHMLWSLPFFLRTVKLLCLCYEASPQKYSSGPLLNYALIILDKHFSQRSKFVLNFVGVR